MARPSACATMCCISLGCWVEQWTMTSSSSPGTRSADLAFEIELLLAADAQPAGAAGAAPRDAPPRRRRAAGQRIGDQDARRQRRLDVEDRRQLLVLDHGELGRAARRVARCRGDGEHRLADELDELRRQQRVVVATSRADVVLARDVGGGQHVRRRRARRGLAPDRRLRILRMRLGREAERSVQQPCRLGQVVDVGRLAGDVAAGAVMGARIVRRRPGCAQTWARLRSPTRRVSAVARGLDRSRAAGCARPTGGSRPRRACR